MNEDTKNHFRPSTFDDVTGQDTVKEFLQIKINAFKKTGRPVCHTLFLGFSGCGKTTMATVLAKELGVNFISVMGTRLKTWNDLYAYVKQIRENDVLFIDEIHALPPKIQEHLYGLMEDFTYTVEDKNMTRPQVFNLPKFTLIGATTHAGSLNAPLLGRFGYHAQLLPYSTEELTLMVKKAGIRKHQLEIPHDVAEKIAKLSCRVARKAYTLLENLIGYAEGTNANKITSQDITIDLLVQTLKHLSIDPILGLDVASRKYIHTTVRENKEIGVHTIASMINEQEETVKYFIEPYLLSDVEFVNPISKAKVSGPLTKITKKGRVPTSSALAYLKIMQVLQSQKGFFPNENLKLREYED
jgi:Holliday junction DNA helicase RuvB